MTRQRSSLILIATLAFAGTCLPGCAQSAASKWAELSPAIRPLPASQTTVLLGVTDQPRTDGVHELPAPFDEPVAGPDGVTSSQ